MKHQLMVVALAGMMAGMMSFSTTMAQAQTNKYNESVIINDKDGNIVYRLDNVRIIRPDHTNAVVETYRIPASQITNAVNDLAASGDICKMFGHWWPQFDKSSFEALANRKMTYRTCRICGKCESKTEGEWR